MDEMKKMQQFLVHVKVAFGLWVALTSLLAKFTRFSLSRKRNESIGPLSGRPTKAEQRASGDCIGLLRVRPPCACTRWSTTATTVMMAPCSPKSMLLQALTMQSCWRRRNKSHFYPRSTLGSLDPAFLRGSMNSIMILIYVNKIWEYLYSIHIRARAAATIMSLWAE